MQLLHTLASFLVALGLLVVIHEFGHFWVARKLGVKILRFSIGFGRPLWRRKLGRDQVEFVVAAVPLGGYVKMLDEREGPVRQDELRRAFNRQTLTTRTAIVVAGPLANFAFAILAYWLMYMVGVTGLQPRIGEVEPGSLAEYAGLQSEQLITAVDGETTPTWETVIHATIPRVLDGDTVTFTMRSERTLDRDVVLDVSGINVDDITRGDLFNKLGFKPYRPVLPAGIGELLAGGAAERAGLQPGDTVISADGVSIVSWGQWVEFVQARGGQSFTARVTRGGELVDLVIEPELVTVDGRKIGRIGAMVANPDDIEQLAIGVERYSPVTALGKAFVKTWDMSILTLRLLGKMIVGEASVKNLSGPISIAQYAGQSASIGMAAFLSFLAIVSVSLGILNLLPIPLLDGGHLLYYAMELVTRRPVSENVQAFGQQIGLVLLLGLMGLAFYNDLARIL